MLHLPEPDLRLLRVIGARAFVHIETYYKKLEVKVVEGRLVGYSSSSKSYRVCNPATRRIVVSGNVNEAPSCLCMFPPSLEEISRQIIAPSNGMDDLNYITDDDFLRDRRDYTSALEPLLGASSDHIPVGGLSDNPPVTELLERISEITRGTHWTEELQDHCKKGLCPEESLRMEFCRRAFSNRRSSRCRPRAASLETPMAGSQPLQQRGHSRREATPAVTRAGTAAKSFTRRKASNRSDFVHLAALTTKPALPALRELRLYTNKILLDISHET